MKKTPTLLLFGFSGLSLCFAFFKIITNLSLVTPPAIPLAQTFNSDASGLSVLFVCAISNVTVIDPTTCNNNGTADPTDDYYTADIMITFTEPPGTGNLELEQSGAVLDVVSIPVGSLVNNTHTFEDVRLKANGMMNPIEAQFSDLMTCVRTTTAPAVNPCSCAISAISIIDQSKSTCNNNGTLDETDDYYTADIKIDFMNPPGTGNLELELSGAVLDVVSIPVGSLVGNTHTFEDVRLKANGMMNPIEAQFSDLMSCVRTISAPIVDPCSCEPKPSISLESSIICVGDTTTLTYSIAGFREAECIYNLRFSGPSGTGIIASSDTVPVAEKTIIVNNVLGPLGMPPGTYTFTLSGSCEGCEADTATTTLTVTPGPSIGFELNDGEPSVICRGKSTQFKATASFLPSGNCDITGIRIGGQPSDSYIGPVCNGDGTDTYRTCFYVTGTSLPFDISGYKLTIDGVAYPIAFSNFTDSTEVILCATNLPAGVTGIDVTVELADGCSFTVEDLYDVPANCIPDCEITDFRIGGQPGDSYIGPTCNADGTYRTAFYVSGTNLPANPIGYKIVVDGIEYPVAFSQTLVDGRVVIGATGLPDALSGVDVTILLNSSMGCSLTIMDLYDAPNCSCLITDIRVGGQPGDNYIGPTCNADGTYRTAFYVSGTFLPANTAGYKVFVNNIEYPIAFNANVSFNQKVIGVTGLPSGVAGVDVKIELQPDCFFTAPDLYNAPNCSINLTANIVQKSEFIAENNFVHTYTRKKDRKEKELGGCAIIIQKFQPDGFFQWTDVAVFPNASEITFDTPTDLPAGLHRYRAVVQCGSASCSDISEEITIEVLNVDCGTFPWRGNK